MIDETKNNNSSPSGKNKHTVLKITVGVMAGGTILFGAIPDLMNNSGKDSSSVPDRAITTEENISTESQAYKQDIIQLNELQTL